MNKVLSLQEIADIVKPIAEKYGLRAVYLYMALMPVVRQMKKAILI